MSRATGYFELQLISVENPKGLLNNGDCCDDEKSAAEGHCGEDECDTYLRVCLKEYQTEVTTNGPCTYGTETTQVIGGNTFQFKGGQKTGQNRNNDVGKIKIPFQFAWPVSGPCLMEICHVYVIIALFKFLFCFGFFCCNIPISLKRTRKTLCSLKWPFRTRRWTPVY